MTLVDDEVVLPYKPRRHFWPVHVSRARWKFVVAHRRAGKALDIDTPILTLRRGWVTMGSLRDGDFVFDETGAPCRVAAAHPVQRGRPCFEVTFSDGARIVCDEDHLWFTQTKLDRTYHVGERCGPRGAAKYVTRTLCPRSGAVRTTAEIRATLHYGKEVNHTVPVAGPLELEWKPLPLDPYVFGQWLGDGTSRCAHFTTMDEETVDQLEDFCAVEGYRIGPVHSSNSGKAVTYGVQGGLTRLLQDMGVILNKHIPRYYLAGSIEQRTALLRGLMDSDGSIDSRNGVSRCEITQKSGRLIDDIEELLRGLGVKVGRGVKTVNGVSYYRLLFRPPFNPFRLKRKAGQWTPINPTAAFSQKRYIVSVDPVPSRPVRCITVDSPSSLYLCGRELVPTHNTVALVNTLIRALLDNQRLDPPPRYAYIGPSFDQTKDLAWGYMKRYTENVPGVRYLEGELAVIFPGGGSIRLYGGGLAYERLRGIYLDGCVLDEYPLLAPAAFTSVVRPCLADYRGFAIVSGTSNGDDHFHKLKLRAEGEAGWDIFDIKVTDTGEDALSRGEVEEMRNDMSPDEFAREMMNSFEAPVEGAFYSDALNQLQLAGRVASVPPDLAAGMITSWDLGIRHIMCIWLFQQCGRELHWCDYIEGKDRSLAHYTGLLGLKAKAGGYSYRAHLLPHDVELRELSTGHSRRHELSGLLAEPVITVPNHSTEDGIVATRAALGVSWFDRDATRKGLARLRSYRRAKGGQAVSDESEDAADALRTGCVGLPLISGRSFTGGRLRRRIRGLV